MTKAKHIAECRHHALEVLREGTITAAALCFVTEMENHDETVTHPAIEACKRLVYGGGAAKGADLEKFFYEVA